MSVVYDVELVDELQNESKKGIKCQLFQELKIIPISDIIRHIIITSTQICQNDEAPPSQNILIAPERSNSNPQMSK